MAAPGLWEPVRDVLGIPDVPIGRSGAPIGRGPDIGFGRAGRRAVPVLSSADAGGEHPQADPDGTLPSAPAEAEPASFRHARAASAPPPPTRSTTREQLEAVRRIIERARTLTSRELASLRPVLDLILRFAAIEHGGGAINNMRLCEESNLDYFAVRRRVVHWRELGIWPNILAALGIHWDIRFAGPRVDDSAPFDTTGAPTVTAAQLAAAQKILVAYKKGRPLLETEIDSLAPTLNCILAIAHIERSGVTPAYRRVVDSITSRGAFYPKVRRWRDDGVWSQLLDVLGITQDIGVGNLRRGQAARPAQQQGRSRQRTGQRGGQQPGRGGGRRKRGK